MFGARFDDVATGSSFILTDPVTSFTATSIDRVGDVVDAASRAASQGHWVAGYVTYDAAGAFDAALRAEKDPTVPYAWFGVFGGRREVAAAPEDPPDGSYTVSRWTPLVERATYDDAFTVIKDHIGAGDAYQVNLTFPLRAAFSGDPEALYLDLLAAQEAGYASHVWHDATHIVSVSPERFFAVTGGHIVTEPMKGTRPRGRWEDEDRRLRDELGASEKDRAENLMIVDLLRNDLGHVARFGTVTVDRLFTIERYRTVWQMTSTVSADLTDRVTMRDIFTALFPCGSVTGAPKTTAMEIISKVETHPRGVYCGAIGFIPPGDGTDGASFSVAIRTAVVNLDEGVVHYGVGGGVTWDSSVDGEYDEALAKALVLTSRPLEVGLIETLRWDDGWLWLDEHLARMATSASFLAVAIPITDVRIALDELGTILREPSRVRVLASADGGVSIVANSAPTRFATGPGPDGGRLSVAIDFDPVDRGDLRLFHKTADRTVYEVRRRRHPDADDVILTNDIGNITETTIGNIVCLFGDTWVTPPIEDGLLPGILRRQLLDDGVIVEGAIPVGKLLEADAVAVINSVRGWRSASVVQSA